MKHEWSVRVRTESTEPLIASARNHSWRVGEPITFAPKDDQPSAVELVVGALGADLIGSLRRVCRLRRIDFAQAELSLRWTLDNALTYVGVVGEEGTSAIDKIEGVAYVSTFDELRMEEAWAEALRRSPLFNTLSRAADITVRLSISN